jgi:hypothetical protein
MYIQLDPSNIALASSLSPRGRSGCVIRPHGTISGYLRLHFEDEPGRRSAAKLLSKDEARRIIVKLS